GLGVGLVALGLVAPDDDVEEVSERQAGKGKLDRRAALRRHDAEPVTAVAQLLEHGLDPEEALERLVERLVVLAVDTNELGRPAGAERLHLRFEPGAADVGE